MSSTSSYQVMAAFAQCTLPRDDVFQPQIVGVSVKNAAVQFPPFSLGVPIN